MSNSRRRPGATRLCLQNGNPSNSDSVRGNRFGLTTQASPDAPHGTLRYRVLQIESGPRCKGKSSNLVTGGSRSGRDSPFLLFMGGEMNKHNSLADDVAALFSDGGGGDNNSQDGQDGDGQGGDGQGGDGQGGSHISEEAAAEAARRRANAEAAAARKAAKAAQQQQQQGQSSGSTKKATPKDVKGGNKGQDGNLKDEIEQGQPGNGETNMGNGGEYLEEDLRVTPYILSFVPRVRDCLKRLGGGESEMSPRWSYPNLVKRSMAYRSVAPARTEEDGPGNILFVVDNSGSCYRSCNTTDMLARLAALTGLPNIVATLVHSNMMWPLGLRIQRGSYASIHPGRIGVIGYRADTVVDPVTTRIVADVQNAMSPERKDAATPYDTARNSHMIGAYLMYHTLAKKLNLKTVVFFGDDDGFVYYEPAAHGLYDAGVRRIAFVETTEAYTGEEHGDGSYVRYPFRNLLDKNTDPRPFSGMWSMFNHIKGLKMLNTLASQGNFLAGALMSRDIVNLPLASDHELTPNQSNETVNVEQTIPMYIEALNTVTLLLHGTE